MDRRLGTLLDYIGRPKAIVEIVRLGPKQVRIYEDLSTRKGASRVETKVPRDRIVEDGGVAYRRYGHSKNLATYLDSRGEPAGMVKVVRAYKYESRVRFYGGEDRYPTTDGWGREETVMTRDLRWDAGTSWGKNPSKWDSQDDEDDPDEEDDPGSDGVALAGRPEQVESVVPAAGAATVAYMRVSSGDQNLDRQAEEITRAVGTVDKEFTDKISASGHVERPGLEACLNYLRAGDVLVVASIDRLARSLVDLRTIVDEVVAKGARVQFVAEGLSFGGGNDPRSNLMLSILGSFAEFERAIIRERQAEGIAAAKKRGVYKGRKPALTAPQITVAREMKAAGMTVTAIAQHFGVHRSTIHRAFQD